MLLLTRASPITRGGGACTCTPAYDSGDRTASITVTAGSGTLTGAAAASNFVDGSTANNTTNSTYWATFGMTIDSSKWLRFDFGAGNSAKITEATWYQNGTNAQGTWKWRASDDASSWTDIGSSFALGGAASQVITELSGNATGYRYYELTGVSGSAFGQGWLQEITFKRCTC